MSDIGYVELVMDGVDDPVIVSEGGELVIDQPFRVITEPGTAGILEMEGKSVITVRVRRVWRAPMTDDIDRIGHE